MRRDRREGRSGSPEGSDGPFLRTPPLLSLSCRSDRRDASVVSADGISVADSSLNHDLALASHMTAPLETPSRCTQVDESQVSWRLQ